MLLLATFVALYRAYRWAQIRRLRRRQRAIQQRMRVRELRNEIQQREEEIQQRNDELQERDQRLEQLKAIAEELSPYNVVGDRVLHREDQQLLERIFQFVEGHVADTDLSPEMIASELCMSYRTLYRRLHDISDKTLAAIIRDVRMEHARKLMMQTKLTIDQVAMQVGYLNRGSFYKHFAARFGCTPRQFQEKFAAEVIASASDDVRGDDASSIDPSTLDGERIDRD